MIDFFNLKVRLKQTELNSTYAEFRRKIDGKIQQLLPRQGDWI
jgi:hypothetical protein